VAFCRVDDKEIRLREPVLEPDALIIQDPTLLHQVELFNGLVAGGSVLLNTSRTLAELGLSELARDARGYRFTTVPATELALKHVGRPLPNAALLGGFAAATGVLRLDSVLAAIRDKFPHALAEKNVAAASEAFAAVDKTPEPVHA
jgi:pyruvate ferredoxin oxidoreductase gamma subunit